jgi:hypothetical protein
MTLLWSALAPQFNAGFPDADSYYHGQIAQMMINQRGFVHDYPWLTFMSWHDQFIDGHLGYHIWLIPFVGLWGLTLGMKISAAAGAILAIGVLYWGLRRLNPAWALWLTWLAILTNQFMFRLSLPRAPAVAICLLIPFIFAVVERRWRLVGLLSFIFAFAYHSWPVLSVVVVIGLISELLTRRHQPRVNLWPLLGWHALGITASYLINPYFPINIRFAWLDIFQIGLLNDRQAIRVGGEWYPTNDQAFVQAVIWPTLLIATVCLVIVLARRFKQRQLIEITSSQQRPRLFFGLLTTLFFVLAAGSQRYFEYLIPSILLLTAALLPIIKPFITRLRLELGRDAMGRFVIGLTCLALIFGPLATNLRDLTELRTTNDQNAVVVQPGLNALAKQIAPGSVVFHNRWDDGPTFAVAEPRLRYLIGLDPTFFAAYDRTAFETWRRICQNKSVNLATDLRSLGAQGVVIRSIGREQAETMPLTTHISALPNSERVYTSTNLVAFILH